MEQQVVRVPEWSKTDWLIHGFSTRSGGNLGFTQVEERQTVVANRGLFLEAAAGSKRIRGMVTLRQVHSALIRRVGATDVLPSDVPAVQEGDGLMTDEWGVLLAIQTADCLPVLVADRKQRAVAAFHAGWRGTLARIVEQGVGRMREEFGSVPEDLVAAVGPGIGPCCYTVGEEVRQQFASQFVYATELFQAMQLDLAEANRRQLMEAGVNPSAIAMTGHCTGCRRDLFFSHRMEQGRTGRLMSVIGIAVS